MEEMNEGEGEVRDEEIREGEKTEDITIDEEAISEGEGDRSSREDE